MNKPEAWCALANLLALPGKPFNFSERVDVRPLDMPEDRPEARRAFWVARGEFAEPVDDEWQPALKTTALKQAAGLKKSSAQVRETLKLVPNKKGGPDGISFRMLKDMLSYFWPGVHVAAN